MSDFVVDGLAETLEIGAQLVERVNALLAPLTTSHISDVFQSEMRDLALLDLKMLEAGIVHSGLAAPAHLVQLVDQFAGNEVPGLTYEDLVLVNPPDDMRIFTRGVVGQAERNFYSEHRMIEEHLASAIQKVHSAVFELLPIMHLAHDPNVPAAIRALGGVEDDLLPVIARTAGLKEMPSEHFAMFRKYLNSHPVRGLKGPSGAFTAGIPTLELLLRGDELPPEYFKYLETSMRYFPRAGRTEISEVLHLLHGRNTLISLWQRRGENPILRSRIDVVGTFLNDFRAAHYRTVAHQIPEAIRGEIAGTGGEVNPGTFLRERIKITRFPKGEK